MSKKSGGLPNTLLKYFSKLPSIPVRIGPCIQDQIVGPIHGESTSKGTISTPVSKRELERSSDGENSSPFNLKKKPRVISFSSDEDCSYNLESFANKDSEITDISSLKEITNITSLKEIQPNELWEVKDGTVSLDEPMIWPHNKLEFLKPENIKDRKGRRPNNPGYNPRTLHVPETYLSTLTPGLRQWWELKSHNYDCILFFKVGKFYELYHMDADIAVKELGFTYMRGEFAHAGFPEISYEKIVTTIVDRGYKVARVEQTETPDMMVQRCKHQRTVTKCDRVVKREICQITNRGTQVFGVQYQVTAKHQPNFMLAVAEKNRETGMREYGISFIDTSIGDFYIGQFTDDKNCSRFLTLLSHNPPVLVLYERGGTSQQTQNILKTVLSNTIKEMLSDSQFLSANKTLKNLAEKYFSNGECVNWPANLKIMQDDGDHLGLTPIDDFKLGLRALGACIWYLTQCHLDQQIMSMARFNIYTPPDILSSVQNRSEEINNVAPRIEANRNMVLDSITISNLRIIDETHSLLCTLDHCCTKFGKRLLNNWLCSPSCDIHVIRERQDAISELMSNIDMLQEVRGLFNTLPDFERHLAQIHGFGNCAQLKNHPDNRAILFEEKTYNKKKIQNFITVLRAFHNLVDIPQKFFQFKSNLIIKLTQTQPRGHYPELEEILNFFKNCFNQAEALREGIIAPRKGVDHEFDSIEEEIENIKNELQEYRTEQEKYFGCRINYYGNDKKRFQLEIPESNARKADDKYFLEGQKNGSKPVRRFHTMKTKEFLRRMNQMEEEKNNVLKNIAGRIFTQFSRHYNVWKSCVDSVAVLDVLLSMAEFNKFQPVICIPDIIEDISLPFIEINEGYYPCLPVSDNYIPNDITLGGSRQACLALLTGPNMGGKSTLMRQVGLLAIMAQIGAHIPAKKCRMTLIDRIFTRLGAHDDILAGHSTFLVELNETASILKHSTVNSLVLLDELGRGTATYDGTAIAASVVNFLADLKCRTLFSTHYHSLVDYFQRDDRVTLGHMLCMVENEDEDDPTQDTVIFLYKYSSGACPKSYGFNAAKLAGMPHSVIKRAFEFSKKLEAIAVKKKIFSQIISKSNVSQIKDLICKAHGIQMKPINTSLKSGC